MFSTLGLIQGRDNRQRSLRAVRNLLRPGGEFVVHVHNHHYNVWRHEGRVYLLNNWIQTRRGRSESGDKFLPTYRGVRNMYVHVFTEEEITTELEKAGFTLLDVLALNRRRNGVLRPCPRWLRRYCANGFLIRAATNTIRPDNCPPAKTPGKAEATTT